MDDEQRYLARIVELEAVLTFLANDDDYCPEMLAREACSPIPWETKPECVTCKDQENMARAFDWVKYKNHGSIYYGQLYSQMGDMYKMHLTTEKRARGMNITVY